MRVDIVSNPKPLAFGQGEGAFNLQLRRWSSIERAMVFDAVASQSLFQMQVAIEGLVLGWTGVTDAAGVPVPFERLNDQNKTVSNFSAVMGAVGVDVQVEVVLAIIAFLGIPVGDVEKTVRSLRPTGDLRPTSTQDGAMPPTASNG
jgi:hypothetical protein